MRSSRPHAAARASSSASSGGRSTHQKPVDAGVPPRRARPALDAVVEERVVVAEQHRPAWRASRRSSADQLEARDAARCRSPAPAPTTRWSTGPSAMRIGERHAELDQVGVPPSTGAQQRGRVVSRSGSPAMRNGTSAASRRRPRDDGVCDAAHEEPVASRATPRDSWPRCSCPCRRGPSRFTSDAGRWCIARRDADRGAHGVRQTRAPG